MKIVFEGCLTLASAVFAEKQRNGIEDEIKKAAEKWSLRTEQIKAEKDLVVGNLLAREEDLSRRINRAKKSSWLVISAVYYSFLRRRVRNLRFLKCAFYDSQIKERKAQEDKEIKDLESGFGWYLAECKETRFLPEVERSVDTSCTVS